MGEEDSERMEKQREGVVWKEGVEIRDGIIYGQGVGLCAGVMWDGGGEVSKFREVCSRLIPQKSC